MDQRSTPVQRRTLLQLMGSFALAPAAYSADRSYPQAAIRFILPFSAGSSTDVLSRVLAEQLGQQLGQPVVVENKPGASGIIGTQQLARAAPDAYTIGLVSLASMAMVPPTLKEAPYDPIHDFVPLSMTGSTDMLLVAGPRAQGKTLQEFVAWGRQQKEPLFLATLGAGTTGHFAGFLLGKAADIRFEPVHFRTFSDLVPALISGAVDVTVMAPAQILPFVKDGKLRGLATNGPTRLTTYPDVPTFKEAGYPDMQFLTWVGIVAPMKTPSTLVERLSTEIIKATNVPAVRTKLEDAGYRVVASSREQFSETIRKDVAIWKDMVRTTGFTV